MSISVGKQVNERCIGLLEGRQQLLPGIPDEVTSHQIIPKPPWKAFYMLSSVSRALLLQIRTRQVYNARVVSHSTETLVIMNHTNLYEITHGYTRIGLYSKKDNSVTELPPIPYCGDWYQWVSLNGKIYLLGAKKHHGPIRNIVAAKAHHTNCRGSNRVFVCDVAEQRQWRECASLNEARTKFGCGVIEGKIYVFGGLSFKPEREGQFLQDPSMSYTSSSEVYDPKEDRWSLIRPMPGLRYSHRVLTVGDELFVLDGMVHFFNGEPLAKGVEVYNPVKDEWRVVHQFGRDIPNLLFDAQGKLYSMDCSSIYVYNAEYNSWTHLHSGPVANVHGGRVEFLLALDDELLGRSCWWEDIRAFRWGSLQRKGFGSVKKEIAWQKLQFQVPYGKVGSYSNRLIQL